MQNKVKIQSIELWRLAFSILIVFCHTNALFWENESNALFRSASIGVEFFFILSGYLMAKSACAKQEPPQQLGTETLQFLKGKFRAIYPTYLFAFVLAMAVKGILGAGFTGKEPIYIFDLLFLRVAGLGGAADLAVGASWYLFAMLLGMYILYPLLRRNKDVFFHIIAPLAAIFILGWFSAKYGHLHFQLDFSNGICLGLFRGISEMCVGCVCYALCERVKLWNNSKGLTALATICETVPFAAVIVIAKYCYRFDKTTGFGTQTDFICVLLLAIGMIAAFSEKSATIPLLAKWDLRWVSKFSLALYLNHVVWIRMLNDWKTPVPFEWHVAAVFALSILTAVICVLTVDLISGKIKTCKNR